MKKIAIFVTLLALGLLAGAASAQQHAFQGVCEFGGRQALVSGLPSTNYQLGIIPKCTVTVYLTGTMTKATITTDGSTPLANPFTANVLGSAAPGSWLFYAADGQGYDVVMSGGSPVTYPAPVTLTDLIHNSGGGGGGSCGPLSGDATSTNCGNGNFTSFTGTHAQAFGYTNIGTLSQSYVVAVGNNSVTGGTSSNQDIIGIGDYAANLIHTSGDLIAIGDSPAENVNFSYGICIGASTCTPHDQTNPNTLTGDDVIALGDSALQGSTGSTAVNDIIAVGQGAAAGLVATSGTNANIIALGNGVAANYTAAVNNIVVLGNAAGSQHPSDYSPSTFAPFEVVGLGDGTAVDNGGSNIVGVGESSAGHFAAGSHDIVGLGNSAASGSITGSGPLVLPVVADLIGIGQGAGARDSGNEVIAIGDWTLGQSNCGGGFTGNTGNYNTGIGDHALAYNGSGTHNIGIGYFAGSNGWTDCSTPGNSNITGSQNTWIGDNSGPNTTTQLSNTIALGYNAAVSASNQTVIGNSSITSLTLWGTGNGCLSSTSGVITGSGSACGSGGGGGSNVEVNGGGTLATANFSSTTPAAGTNGINVTFQTSSINVSAEIVGDGVSTHFLNGTGAFSAPVGGGTTTNALTMNNSGSGASSGTTFNGSAAETISYNTIGAQQALTLTTTGTSGPATLSAGTLNIPQYTGGGGSGTVSGQASGVVGLATGSTTTGAQSHLNENTSGVDTFTQAVAVNDGTGVGGTFDSFEGTAATKAANHDVLYGDSTSHCMMYSPNNLAFACLPALNVANTFTATQTVPALITTGSSPIVSLGQGTAATPPSNSIGLIAPASVPTAYNFIFPAGPPSTTGPTLLQCSGSSTSCIASLITGSMQTAASVSNANYSDVTFNGSHTDGARLGILGGNSGSGDPNLYFDTPAGGVHDFRINTVSGVQIGQIGSSGYYGVSVAGTGFTSAGFIGVQGDPTGSDKSLYFNAGSGGQLNGKIANVTAFTVAPGNHPTGGCPGYGYYFQLNIGDGYVSYCNNSTYTVIAHP